MADYDVVLEHVDKTFEGDVRAVIDFSAEIERGEFVALLGPSGSGKTTTLRMIGGLDEASAGKIYIAGQDVTIYCVVDRRIKVSGGGDKEGKIVSSTFTGGNTEITVDIDALDVVPDGTNKIEFYFGATLMSQIPGGVDFILLQAFS